MSKSTCSTRQRKIPTTRPLYKLFMERVINIEPVQRHRAAAVGDYDPRPGMITHFKPGERPRVYHPPHRPADFFSKGCHSGQSGEFMWPLDAAMQEFPWVWGDTNVSLPLLHAWNAAAVAFNEWIREIVDGKWIVSGVHPATGARHDRDPAELTRPNLILDVRKGDLFEVCNHVPTVQLSDITLRVAEPAGAADSAEQASDGETGEAALAGYQPDLIAAIKGRWDADHRPGIGGNETWDEFCHEVRRACGKATDGVPDRGYGNKTIKNIVSALYKQDK